jgi:3-hydroxyacyl-CoA dehydrogenase / enoyl-CoA hydratase / 3-hydroxybutyryl-CoA epimerase
MNGDLLTADDRHVKPGTASLDPESSRAPVSREETLTCVHRRVTDDQICIVTFDRPESSANVFDRTTLEELNTHIDFIGETAGLRGVVLTSAKNSIFIAGADLHAMAGAAVPDLADLIELGQSVFNRLASLPVPTVAAIHGACVGGGYELCLACDCRVASPDRATKIGLPETQLGILPGWGGSTRLPRLVGLPRALDVILGGRTIAAKLALRYGMVDELAPRERLVELACRKISKTGAGLKRRPRKPLLALTNNRLFASAASLRVESQLLKKTRGHYPAVFKALEVVTKAVGSSIGRSLAREREAVLELAQTEECRNLMRVFFMQEHAKKQSYLPGHSPTTAKPVDRAAVIGAGVMGAGIAQWLSSRGLPVILRDVNAEQVAKGMAAVAQLYYQGVKRHAFTRLEATTGLDHVYPSAAEVPLHNLDLVIEAAVEKMELKKAIFRRLAELAGPDTILATNTSALSVSEIATGVPAPERVVGIHFFNPVHRMQLVEVVVARQTHAEVVQRALRFVQSIGKLPVVVKDSPGFLVNRILMPYLIEAGHLFESGARVEDLDEAMLDFGMPMGPLRLIDEVGVDVAQHVAEELEGKFSDRMRAPRLLAQMLKAGLLGRKSARGFYLYQSKHPETNSGLNLFQEKDWAKNLGREELQRRLVLLMVNEAARCLEEEIVAQPSEVDFAMIMGTGFAPFRGGPLQYADSLGAEKIVGEMKRIADSGAAYFEPCSLLRAQATQRKKFYPEEGARP